MIAIETKSFGDFYSFFDGYGPNQPVVDASLAGLTPAWLWADPQNPQQEMILITRYGFTFGWGNQLESFLQKQATKMKKTLTFIPSRNWKGKPFGNPVPRLEFLGPNQVELIPGNTTPYQFIQMDEKNYLKSTWKDVIPEVSGDPVNFMKNGGGLALTDGQVFVAEAIIGFVGKTYTEIGTVTHPDHRGKGYSTLVCGELIKRLQAQGRKAYWSCRADNLGSAQVAKKLAFEKTGSYTAYQVMPV